MPLPDLVLLRGLSGRLPSAARASLHTRMHIRATPFDARDIVCSLSSQERDFCTCRQNMAWAGSLDQMGFAPPKADVVKCVKDVTKRI